MATDILMPALSPTMTEGKLGRWLKKPGDPVAPGDVIAEIETDKATMEVEAVDEGVLGPITVPEGTEGVPVNAVIATLLGPGDNATEHGAKSPAPAAAPRAQTPSQPIMTSQPPTTALPSPTSAVHAPGGRIAASPLARRLAKMRGIDLSRLHGTGPHGRIIRADLDQTPGVTTPSIAVLAAPVATKSSDARHLSDLLGMVYEQKPNSGIRKTIARRLVESKQTVPHFYLTVDCLIDPLLGLRQKLNAAATPEGKVSVNDFVIRAAALALRKIPDANVSWTDEAILAYRDVDISVAVATPAGLVTPIIRQADGKSLRQIAAEMRALAAKARDGKLRPQEFQGGTFSISNLGMYGIREFSAIINPPQACILAVGAGEQRPVVRDGQLGVATLMTCTLSVDHRAVDGALGAEYLSAFKGFIEDPYSLLM